MGRTQSAFSVIATVLQIIMSFTLGWFAQNVTLSVAFLLLGGIYGGAVVAAVRARTLSHAQALPTRVAG
jgi:NhaP-type Na+/H+ or K+/H+ antiporter